MGVRSASLMLVVLVASAAPAPAQYDRDGRYVPSPMGVPADPHARPVPLHPGTPGGAVGTPIWPRGAMPPPPYVQPRPPDPVLVPLPSSRPLSPAQCRREWTPRLGMSRDEFDARCRLILKHRPRGASPAGS